MYYEIMTHPDDIPVMRDKLRDAEKVARRMSDRTGYPALVYEVDEATGSRLIGIID